MKIAVNAHVVLDLLSENWPQIGASEAAWLLGRDNASVQRYLDGLTAKEMLEQDPRDNA